jgi:hypothetical protein
LATVILGVLGTILASDKIVFGNSESRNLRSKEGQDNKEGGYSELHFLIWKTSGASQKLKRMSGVGVLELKELIDIRYVLCVGCSQKHSQIGERAALLRRKEESRGREDDGGGAEERETVERLHLISKRSDPSLT